MDRDEIIRFEGVGKRYRLGVNHSYKTMAEKLTSLFLPSPKDDAPSKGEIWAVRDVDLSIKQGEIIGIIGRNGSGKSTLLKLLTRITQPTCGRIQYKGRIGALLEVGTGFHPELTGLENIMMNGLILGMTRAEIRSRLDEIIDFAGVEKFLDTPVKRYSSGMRVRLGFAIAAHLDPEILIVDEVLAVGDAQFQHKCLNRMGEAANEGRTVIFVSHQLDSIVNLCKKALWLEAGSIRESGLPEKIISNYLTHTRQSTASTDIQYRTDRRGSGDIKISDIEFFENNTKVEAAICSGSNVELKVHFTSNMPYDNVDIRLKVIIRDHVGRLLTVLSNEYIQTFFNKIGSSGQFNIRIPRLSLYPGMYHLDFVLRANSELLDELKQACFFEVFPGDYFSSGHVSSHSGAAFFLDQEWSIS